MRDWLRQMTARVESRLGMGDRGRLLSAWNGDGGGARRSYTTGNQRGSEKKDTSQSHGALKNEHVSGFGVCAKAKKVRAVNNLVALCKFYTKPRSPLESARA